MNRRNALRIAAALLIVGFAGIARPVVATENDTFGVDPEPLRVDGMSRGTFEIPLEPGAEFEDAIRIYNRSDQSLELNIYGADAEAGVDGTISVGFRASHPVGVGAWIKLPASSVTIPPRGQAVVKFHIDVGSSNPTPSLGAIVVEHTGKGQAASLAQRLRLIVRTVPPNSPTTSRRVRSLLLRSPWIIIAILGLVVALVLVWVGRRRTRRSKDAVVPAGAIEELRPDDDALVDASRPVVRRLGSKERDGRPLLDDEMVVEVDEGPEFELEQIAPPPRPKPSPRQKTKPSAKKKVSARTASEVAKRKPTAAKKAKPTPKRTTARKPKRAPTPKKPAPREGQFIPLDDS